MESIYGEWIAVDRTKGGLGAAKTYQQDNNFKVTFGALVDFTYVLNGNKLTLSFPGSPDDIKKVKITQTRLTITDDSGNKQELSRLDKSKATEIIGEWIGDHYTGGKQILHFTNNNNCYLAVPFMSEEGSFILQDTQLVEKYRNNKILEYKWLVQDEILILTSISSGKTERYKRKK